MSEQITIDAEADRMPSVTIPAHHCDTDPVASVVHRIDGWEAPKWATHSDFTENSITWDREVIVKADELAPALARFDRIEIDLHSGTIAVTPGDVYIMVGETEMTVADARLIASALVELADAAEAGR
jgi:hypothetical protein